ncbi:cobalt/nickel transport system ATP-binding protein [Metabacillus crassostreae]|uniref:energy-coupling factor ABC transporter ATP-binding protein n=1 Tax=Metabacillus crassostreae TaxID=929098 RepID=UPI00195D7575|nr:ATP-binding cassette domain-containing protein [Metabacillus crassostreae]MBM7603011.1 cobalt/nickel transport system ATP-binding protein [Metabacillus crassostreae]
MKTPIVSMKNVTYEYPDKTLVLKGLTLHIDRGKKIALIGNNGAGKSTLFLLLNGILKPSSGDLFFNESKISYSRKDLKKLRQKVGIVFQQPDTQLFSSSVYEDIKFGPKNLGLTQEEIQFAVNEAIMLTETGDFKDKPPHFLSLGQKKRVAIAGIIAMNPELMVLDEPTASLDPYYAKKIMKILEDIHHENRTILLSTHNVDLAYEWADEIIILHNGAIMAQGTPVEVFQNKELLNQCHLEQPMTLEIYQQVLAKHHASIATEYPLSKKQLIEKLASLLPI